MDRHDQQAIDGLFSKLARVEQQSGPRDPESERFIQEQIVRQPGAPYYMAQTIVVQEQALEAAQRRIEELEYEASQGQQRSSGGFLSSIFGTNAQQPLRQAPQRVGYGQAAYRTASPWGGQGRVNGQQVVPMQQKNGGGFLAGAAQTAMGVAGGVLLGNAVGGMFGGGEAKAAEAEAAAPDADTPADEMDFGDEEI